MADPADITTRLRAVLHNDRSVELMNREAADEIERLRAERDEARRENEQLKRYANYCRPQSGSNHKLRSNIDRTDLPSDVIDDISYAYGEIMRIYKLLDDQTESTQKALQERETYFMAHDELLAQTIELRSERDEARREVCDLKTFNFDNTISAYRYADLRKWDCYKDRTDD